MPKQWVFEAIMDVWPEWPGNELYDTLEYAKFCAMQDYSESFPTDDNPLSWEVLVKGVHVLYSHEDEGPEPTGVEIRLRNVNTLGK